MANIFLAWQNRADEGVLSGGSWLTALPLVNLQNRQVQKVGRTTNTAQTSTRFDIDLQSSKQIGVLALVVHNISVSGRVRVSASNSSTAWTNLLSNPSSFENAAWTKATCNVTANADTAPDGTVTADLLVATSVNSGVYQAVAIAGSTEFQGSVWLRAAAPTTLNIVTIQSTTTLIETTCNVTTDWQKFTVSGTTDAGTTSIGFYIGGNGSFQSAEAVYAWDANLLTGLGIIFEGGWNDVWPAGVIPQDLLEWEDDNFWLGTLSQEARAGFQSPYILRLPNVENMRYWRVEISDTSNSDGYVQIGRLFMARGWTPTINYTYGASLGYQDPTPVETSLSGAEYFDIRSKFRVFTFKLDYISDTDAYSYALELQRLAGISGEVLIIPDGGEDLAQQPLRSFVGRLRQIGSVSQPQPTTYSVNFEVKELL
jgi:hypothetical protein